MENLHGWKAASERQDRVAIAPTSGSQRSSIIQTSFLEGCEGISAQHLGPFVAVVAGGVSYCKDMPEAAQETVFRQRRQHGGQGGNTLLHVKRGGGALRLKMMVQSHVQAGEVQLTQHEAASTIRPRRTELAIEFL